MPRVSREKFNSGFFHIMIQGINKEYIFKEDENKNKYLFLMKKYYGEYNIKIISYCIMNNHAHFIIYSDDIKQISNYMHKINTIYAMDYNTINKRVGYLFRNRYKSQYIDNRDYLFKCIKYIHLNPVRAHIVREESEYKYSSYNDFLCKKEYINDDVLQLIFGSTNNYLDLFKNIEDVDVEIMDVDNDNQNFEAAVKKYLIRNNIKLEEIKNSKVFLYDFTKELLAKRIQEKTNS